MKLIACVAMFAAFLALSLPARGEIVRVGREKNTCRFCHGAEGRQFGQSAHAEFGLLCTSCHGGDGTAIEKKDAMSPAKGFTGKIPAGKIPGLCAGCHSDFLKMRQYGIEVDQLDQYKLSVHGQRLLGGGDTRVAQCVSCHGAHAILRVTDPDASVYPVNVPKTCSKCHGDKELMSQYKLTTNEVESYDKSVHWKALKKGNLSAPSCASCHGSHGAAPPGTGEIVNICGKCHLEVRDVFIRSPHFRAKLLCINCHSNHGIEQPGVAMFKSKKTGGCLSCHKNENDPAGSYIRSSWEMLTVSELKIAAAEKDIAKAAADGMDVRPERALLASAKDGMGKFAFDQHRLTLKSGDDILSRLVNSPSEQIQTEIQAFYDAKLNRKIVMGIVAACLLILIGIVYARRRVRKET